MLQEDNSFPTLKRLYSAVELHVMRFHRSVDQMSIQTMFVDLTILCLLTNNSLLELFAETT